VSWLFVLLLACAVGVLVAAEWPRLGPLLGLSGRKERERAERKAAFRLLRGEADESDDFAASVERDLSQLPTIEERDPRQR
jgi:hypothetical protein